MSVPAAFVVAAIVLVAVALFFLLRPLLRPRPTLSANRRALNVAIHREQLRELESDLADGTLTQAAFEEASRELQRRLLTESEGEDGTAVDTPRASKRSVIAVAAVVPVAAIALYMWLGTPEAMSPEAGHRMNAGNMEEMVAALAARLEKNPDDLNGWAMLARSYKALGRFDDAEKAFARLGDALYTDASLLASYADLLAVRANGNLEGKPRQLVEKALALEPDHTMALSLAGTAAYNRKDFANAVLYWERLLQTLPEGSEDAEGVARTIAKLREEHGLKKPGGGKEPTLAAKEGAKDKGAEPKAAGGTTLSGRIELSKAAIGKVSATDTVFILARPVDARMPLAIQRSAVANLPQDFTLDESMGIMGGPKLSETPEVVVEARVSKSGQATVASGDWLGRSAPVKPGAKGIKIVIDQQVP